MQSLVGKRVKFIGTHDDLYSLGKEDSAVMLWNNTGVVHSGPSSAGDGNRQWCTVRYTGDYLVESFTLPFELLEVVE